MTEIEKESCNNLINSSETLDNPNLSIFYQFELSEIQMNRLKILNDYKIVYIVDDSSSMNIIESNNISRWDELFQFLRVSLELTAKFTTEGSDVYFLNRLNQGCVSDIKNINQLQDLFKSPPDGASPLTKTIQNAIDNNPLESLHGKKLLLIIATAGEPTDEDRQPCITEFIQCLQNRPDYVFTTIRACTNDQIFMTYLNQIDKFLPRLDTIDDYDHESKEIKAKGNPCSYGDYILKTLLGSISNEFDHLEEIRNS